LNNKIKIKANNHIKEVEKMRAIKRTIVNSIKDQNMENPNHLQIWLLHLIFK
jgi:hypothetical protein